METELFTMESELSFTPCSLTESSTTDSFQTLTENIKNALESYQNECDIENSSDSYNNFQNDEDLSKVIEPSNDEKCNKIYDNLHNRFKTLQETILKLREQLKRELSMWKKEREEYQLLQERNNILLSENINSSEPNKHQNYFTEKLLLEKTNAIDQTELISADFKDLSLSEYEKKLLHHRNPYISSHIDKRCNLHRKIISEVYEKKFTEIDRLCNEELENVKLNTNHIQLLLKTASEWNIYDEKSWDSGENNFFKQEIGIIKFSEVQ